MPNTFSITISADQLIKGLRPLKRVPRNNRYLVESIGAVGRDGVLQAIDELTRMATTGITDSFPFPQIFVFTNLVIVCSQTKIYEWINGALVLKLTVTAGSTWTAVDFFDYVYMSNGKVSVIRNSVSQEYFVTGILTSAGLAIGTTNTAVANGAFTYYIAGTTYAKVANLVGTAPGNDVIPQNKYGAVAFDIGTDGTIHAIEATDNATGYTTAILAIAGLPAIAIGHVRMGTVTAMKSDGAFTFGTTPLNVANSNVVYTSTPACTTLPTASAMCNFNGQVLIGAPDVTILGASLTIKADPITLTITQLGGFS